MTPEDALARGKAYLDEATENLTFDEFGWAFEETWHGVAWILNAMSSTPQASVATGDKGELPAAGSLEKLCGAIDEEPAVAVELEALRTEIADAGDETGGFGNEIAGLVFDAWELHDACGRELGMVDERLGDDRLVLTEASPGRLGSRIIDRRTALKIIAAGSIFPAAACERVESDNRRAATTESSDNADGPAVSKNESAQIKAVTPIASMQWETTDPFLFCAHHRDDYPEGNADLGPAASLAGRHLGRDFDEDRAWRMYHGQKIPGFPRHPHRGFETVTVVRTGYLDHADSMGATARYGGGDVQWLTSGRGIQHAEMFPLLRRDDPNPLELFQVWLNLPRADKMVDPYFTMLWREEIPRITERDEEGREVELTIAAGSYADARPPEPPPNSWGHRDESDIAIWSIGLAPKARFELPPVADGTLRSLYVHTGDGVRIADRAVDNYHRVEFEEPGAIEVQGGPSDAEILLLQGRPIDEPVAKRGPFVMNTQSEIQQAYADYQRTAFGGWPWEGDGPVHEGREGRFARHVDGTYEEPT